MPNETKQRDEKSFPSRSEPAQQEAAQREAARPALRPYHAPQLRSLGRVADLTFAGGSVTVEHGLHTKAKA
jgi:hypothetical protein